MTPSPFWPGAVAHDVGALPPTLTEALRQSAARRPGHTAIVFYGLKLSYATLLARVERMAGYLQQRCGVQRGDRVLLDMQNSPHFVIGFHAILRAGGVVVPVNPMNLADELSHICSDSGARVALLGAELLGRFAPLMATQLDHLVAAAYGDELAAPAFRTPPTLAESTLPAELPPQCVPWNDALQQGSLPGADGLVPDDLCVMPYTSGTTGRPKACAHPHATAVFSAVAMGRWYGYDDDTVVTGFMPLFHVSGMQVSMNAGLAAGGTIVLMARWDRDLVVPLFEAFGVTVWSAAPTMVVDVLSAAGFSDKAFARLRILTGGGAAMPKAVATALEARFGLRYIEGYGLSESIAATHINPLDRPKPQCLGLAIQGTDARIIDPGHLGELPPGEIGELIVSGPQIMRGYWNRPDADADAFMVLDGKRFLRTGDLARRDDEGYFFSVDRLKRMINVSGYKVWPAECEAILYGHPAIQECCVIATSDPYRGETVKALVVRRPGMALEADAITVWARSVMAAYKIPRVIEFVDALPRSASNKIDWRRLQEAELTVTALAVSPEA
jgi:fatty-acyl-CoA synthase